MKTARLLEDGEGQVVLLPEDIRLEGTEVYVEKIGNVVKLIPSVNRGILLAKFR